MVDVIRVPIYLGGQDPAHQIAEILTGELQFDFGAAASGAIAFATATFIGCRPGMKIFFSPMSAIPTSTATFATIRAYSAGTDVISCSAQNLSTSAAVAGVNAFEVFAVRIS